MNFGMSVAGFNSSGSETGVVLFYLCLFCVFVCLLHFVKS